MPRDLRGHCQLFYSQPSVSFDGAQNDVQSADRSVRFTPQVATNLRGLVITGGDVSEELEMAQAFSFKSCARHPLHCAHKNQIISSER